MIKDHLIKNRVGQNIYKHLMPKTSMKSGLIIAIFALFLLLPLCTATTIKVTTLPGRDVFVSIWTEDGEAQVSPPKKYLSDVYGHVEHTYDGSTSPFSVLVIVKLFGVQEYREEFGPYNSGETVELPSLVPEGYIDSLSIEDDSEDVEPSDDTNTEEDIDSSENSTTNATEDNSEDDADETQEGNVTSLTGSIISEGSLSPETMKIIYYVLGSIFTVGVIATIVVFARMKIRRRGNNQIYGMEPVKLDKRRRYNSSKDEDLSSIENEIETVEKQIEAYKNRSRLSEAERRLEEKKGMLEKLKRGEGVEPQKDQDQKYKRRFY